ncbi:invasion protein IalB [Rhodobacter sp. JA431]|uniref:invasion associated locus B family protein n=1 Tax=Rhodobacter sp. JA431 TaxID=570013 RepID=UPI000BCEB492|nr:invasion associated locus B family protein [Rhodobacter sp. JA431]SOB97974.1 invasion protein IalB [Rhodobacter sp. JA431]
MMKKTKSLALLIAMGLAAPMAWAQDTAAPEAPAAATEATPPAAAVEGPGSTYVKETFDDWQVQCLRTETGNDPCEMFQLLKDGDGNGTAAISIMALPEGEEAVAGATITTPLETLLTQGVKLKIDAQNPIQLPFNVCSQGGCFSNVFLKAQDIDLFKKGNKIAMTIIPAAAPDKPVELTISLKGFTAAFDGLPKPAKP